MERTRIKTNTEREINLSQTNHVFDDVFYKEAESKILLIKDQRPHLVQPKAGLAAEKKNQTT